MRATPPRSRIDPVLARFLSLGCGLQNTLGCTLIVAGQHSKVCKGPPSAVTAAQVASIQKRPSCTIVRDSSRDGLENFAFNKARLIK